MLKDANLIAAFAQELNVSTPASAATREVTRSMKREPGSRLDTSAGKGRFVADLSRGGETAHLWLLKPFGRPILLGADGTRRYALRIDDGRFRRDTLTFTMAEKAIVSSPTAPRIRSRCCFCSI